MTLSQFLSILRARWTTALVILMLTVGLVMGVSLILPKSYTATASLVVDQTRPDPVSGNPFTGAISTSFLATQVAVIKSDRVAQNVARKLDLASDPIIREQWAKATNGVGSIEGWLVDRLQRSLEVTPARDSNVINIVFKDGDPAKAASVANLFVQGYLDINLELHAGPAKQYSSFFDSRAKELRSNLERAQAKLTAFQRERGVIIATDGQLDAETARLNELSSQLVALQAVAAESGSRQMQAQAGAADRLQEVINNPVLAALRGEITKSEARLQELGSRLGENHPQVIETKANIASLRGRLEAESRRVTGSFTVTNSMNRQREAEIRSALEVQRGRVMRMRAAREEGAVLLRDVDAAQRAYDAVLTRLSQTSLESATSPSNSYVLAQAVPPFAPSSPNLMRNGVLSILLGTVLAMAAVIMMEYVDRRVRTDTEVSELVGLPLLGILPPSGGKGHFAGPRVPLVNARKLFRALPAPGKHA